MPAGMDQCAPLSLVITALPPFCAIANQVVLVDAALPVSTKYGYQEIPPVGKPAPPTSCHVSPPSFDSAIPSASCKPLMRCRGSLGSTFNEYRLMLMAFIVKV